MKSYKSSQDRWRGHPVWPPLGDANERAASEQCASTNSGNYCAGEANNKQAWPNIISFIIQSSKAPAYDETNHE